MVDEHSLKVCLDAGDLPQFMRWLQAHVEDHDPRLRPHRVILDALPGGGPARAKYRGLLLRMATLTIRGSGSANGPQPDAVLRARVIVRRLAAEESRRFRVRPENRVQARHPAM